MSCLFLYELRPLLALGTMGSGPYILIMTFAHLIDQSPSETRALIARAFTSLLPLFLILYEALSTK